MFKIKQKNNYQKFLLKKKKFAKKAKKGLKFKDTDGDGLSDYEEKYIYGTNFKNSDSDGDGMKDGDEVKKGRNPLGPGTLKDLFIPHAGNSYKPNALRPKRLLFHVTSVIVIKAVIIAFVLLYPLSAWLSPGVALNEVKKIIDLTNNMRQTVSLPILLESQKLTQAAWQKAEDMAINNYFAHVSPSGLSLKNWLEKIDYKYSAAGENLAVGFSSAEDVIAAWKNSPTHYGNIIDSEFKEIGISMTYGKLNQTNTIFTVQYFGTPVVAEEPNRNDQEATIITHSTRVLEPMAISVDESKSSIEGEKITTEETLPVNAITLPIKEEGIKKEIKIDQQAAVLYIKDDPLNNDKAIKIETILSGDTNSAKVIINGQEIDLEKESNQDNKWSGVAVINKDKEKDILNPLIPASIIIKDYAGGVSYGEIDWDEIKITKVTPLEHYLLYKGNPTANMMPVINLSNLYFKLILCLSLVALILNIFIKIKKQKPRTILYSLAFLCLLVIVIIF